MVTILAIASATPVRTIELKDNALIFERCQGPTQLVDTIALTDISHFTYTVQTARVAIPVYRLTFDVLGQPSDFIIPLDFDGGKTNRALLESLLPAAVVKDYEASMLRHRD